jgi:hypothetical protein
MSEDSNEDSYSCGEDEIEPEEENTSTLLALIHGMSEVEIEDKQDKTSAYKAVYYTRRKYPHQHTEKRSLNATLAAIENAAKNS